MTDKSRIGEDDKKWTLFETLLEMWDSYLLIDFVQKEYQRGFDAGVASVQIDKDALAKEYQRGQDDYRTRLLQHLDVAKPYDVTELDRALVKRPIATGIEDVMIGTKVTAPEHKVDGGTIVAQRPGRGPAITDQNRPVGIPSNYDMIRLALIDAGHSLSAVELRDIVAKRWWPEVPKDWKASPYGFLGSGKLKRDADGKFVLPDIVEKPEPKPKPHPQEIINREVAKRQEPAPERVPEPVCAPEPKVAAPEPAAPKASPAVPQRQPVTPGAKLGPPARREGVEFKYGDRAVRVHQREADILLRLRQAMGKGHLDAKFLGNAVGFKSDAEQMIRDMVSILNPKIAELGLEIKFWDGFGFSMREIAAA